MEMRQRDEAKRSKAWVIVMIASSAIILLLVAYLITNSVIGNPLKGEWLAESQGYQLEIDDDEITVETTIDGQYVEVDLTYTLDKTDRIITLKSSTLSYAEAADDTDGKVAAGQIDEAISEFLGSYNYSIEDGKLTLTKREFEEEIVFTRVEK